jgi:5,10-methylenetetrahydromethanopterin reductase
MAATSPVEAVMATEIWRMGANPVPLTKTAEFARRFEASGWDGFAVAEAAGIIPDPYAVLALAATATTTLRLGTAVAVPLRHPMLAATAMASVQALSGGRARFGIGRGDSAVKILHQKPMPLAEFERYLERLQGYLRHADVDLDGDPTSMARLPAVDPSLDGPRAPIDVAGTGPRTLDAAVRLADGIVISVGADVERLRNSRRLVREAAAAAGRTLGEIELGCYIQMAVIGPGDESGREAIRGITLTHARFSGFEPRPAREDVSEADHREYRHAVETMDVVLRSARGGIVRRERAQPGEIDFYPREAASDQLVDRFAIVGSADYCAERLQQVIDLGFERVMIGTHTIGVDLQETNTDRIARDVLPLVQRRSRPS